MRGAQETWGYRKRRRRQKTKFTSKLLKVKNQCALSRWAALFFNSRAKRNRRPHPLCASSRAALGGGQVDEQPKFNNPEDNEKSKRESERTRHVKRGSPDLPAGKPSFLLPCEVQLSVSRAPWLISSQEGAWRLFSNWHYAGLSWFSF